MRFPCYGFGGQGQGQQSLELSICAKRTGQLFSLRVFTLFPVLAHQTPLVLLTLVLSPWNELAVAADESPGQKIGDETRPANKVNKLSRICCLLAFLYCHQP
jgi:hypothetical protein